MTLTLAPKTARDRLILALDVPDVDAAKRAVEATEGAVGVYKVGLQLVFAGGLPFAEELARAGHRVFLDVKLLDIDNTVAHAVQSIMAMGMTFVTLHAYPKAIRAAIEAKSQAGGGNAAGPCLLGVTVLTSMDDGDLADAGYAVGARELVLKRARDARAAGLDGLVCSPQEVAAVREAVGAGMVLVTPGIRPAGDAAGDQKRIMTPRDAIRAGSDYLVIGRPIMAAANPRAAAERIVEEMAGA